MKIDLINRLTGLEFSKHDEDDFEIRVGPAAIEIFCSGTNAYRIANRFVRRGFIKLSNEPKTMYYIVVNKDYANKFPFHSTTIPHERRHIQFQLTQEYYIKKLQEQVDKRIRGFFAKHQIDEGAFGSISDLLPALYQHYEREKDLDKKADLLRELMRVTMLMALELRVKDELFAIQSETIPPLTKDDLLSIFLPNNTHDYLQKIRTYRNDPLWQQIANEVLVYEYSQIIDAAIKAFDRLVESGYPRLEAIALLSDKTPLDWPKTVKRFLKQTEGKLVNNKPKNKLSSIIEFIKKFLKYKRSKT